MKLFLSMCLAVWCIAGNLAWGEFTEILKIKLVRPYLQPTGNGVVYVVLDDVSAWGTNTYKIDLSDGGGKEAYATVLLAFAQNKSIDMEISYAEGCLTSNNGWGSKIQSVRLRAD